MARHRVRRNGRTRERPAPGRATIGGAVQPGRLVDRARAAPRSNEPADRGPPSSNRLGAGPYSVSEGFGVNADGGPFDRRAGRLPSRSPSCRHPGRPCKSQRGQERRHTGFPLTRRTRWTVCGSEAAALHRVWSSRAGQGSPCVLTHGRGPWASEMGVSIRGARDHRNGGIRVSSPPPDGGSSRNNKPVPRRPPLRCGLPRQVRRRDASGSPTAIEAPRARPRALERGA